MTSLLVTSPSAERVIREQGTKQNGGRLQGRANVLFLLFHLHIGHNSRGFHPFEVHNSKSIVSLMKGKINCRGNAKTILLLLEGFSMQSALCAESVAVFPFIDVFLLL